MVIPFDETHFTPSANFLDNKRDSSFNNKLNMGGGGGGVSERSKKIVY